MNRIISVAICVATLLLTGVDASAQRGATSSRSSSSTTRTSTNSSSSSSVRSSESTRGSSAKKEQATTSSTRSSSSTRSTSTSSSSRPSSDTKPVMEHRGSAQTGTSNKKLKPEHVSPAENYRNLPVRGSKVSKYKATKNAHYVRYGTTDYYYKKGVFYSYDHVQKHYVVTRPPLGVRVDVIPQSRIIYLNDVNYYYYYGVFYRRVATQYEVVAPPVGAIVESIPEGYEQIVVNGNTYYIVDGVQYKAVVYHGEIWYEVIKIMD
ncbi:MAG: hypothetical protein J6Y37_06540 [Paludibacteraceae bacterium]|nr:hypothetical protein [Paludibacteraceae bacterium]